MACQWGLSNKKHADTRFLCVDKSLICLGFQDVVKAVWYGVNKGSIVEGLNSYYVFALSWCWAN